MFPFLTALPFATKLAVTTTLMAAVFVFGLYVGHQWGDSACKDAIIAATTQAISIAERQTVVTDKIVTKYVDRIKTVRGKTEIIIKEIPTYVKTDNNITLPGSFRVWHDAASQNEIPDPTLINDARTVTAPDIAATIGYNYEAFYQNKEQLDALQQWIRDQSEVK